MFFQELKNIHKHKLRFLKDLLWVSLNSFHQEIHLNASFMDEIVWVGLWTWSTKWRLCFGLCPACCGTTAELSCLACHLIDGPGVFNVLQSQPAKTKLHTNDTREKSPWVSHKTLAQNSIMSQNTWRRTFMTETCGIWPNKSFRMLYVCWDTVLLHTHICNSIFVGILEMHSLSSNTNPHNQRTNCNPYA